MLQFNTTFYSITSRCTSRLLWRINLSFSTNATVAATEPVNTAQSNSQEQATACNASVNYNQYINFNELKKNICDNFKIQPVVLPKIQNAQNVKDLLQVINTLVLNENEIKELKEAIATWLNANSKLTSHDKAKSSISHKAKVNKNNFAKSEFDTKINLNYYHDLSTAGMIKEVIKLTSTRYRNTYLLNYFFQNIVEHNVSLKVGQCSSLLYSMSVLNYSDERLLKKICHDLISMDKIEMTLLVPMLRSMASIRYKNEMFLMYACNNIINSNFTNAKRDDEILSILLSLATLGYHSETVNKIIQQHKNHLTLSNIGDVNWLKLVWCLTILKQAGISDVESVLKKTFILSLMSHDPKLSLSHQLKLLNINGYAQYALKNYEGPLLDNNTIPPVTSKRSKQKEVHLAVLKEALTNMLPSSFHFKLDVNTNMGFLLDAEFYMDSDFIAVNIDKLDDPSKKEKLTKMGIVVVDYYETCLGEQDFQGLIKLYTYLLTCKNYKVLCIPYQHFGAEDKLEKHITYLRRQLWKTFNETI